MYSYIIVIAVNFAITVDKNREKGFETMPREKAASILFITGMFGFAALLNNMEIIFPEILALAVGAWVAKRCPWESRRANLMLSPTLAAFTGMALLKFFPYRPLFLICIAFLLVVVELQLLQSDVFPAISAAILPIIVHADSWLYPVSVGILTSIVLLGKIVLDRQDLGAEEKFPEFWSDPNHAGDSNRWSYWSKVFVVVALIAVAAVYLDAIYLLAPPLIVVFIELTQPNSALWHKPFRVLLLISLAAFSGVFWLLVTVELFNLPFWLFGIFAVSWMFLLYHWFEMYLPPAAALTLLPVIVQSEKLWLYPFQVTVGCLIFVLIARGLFNRPGETGEPLQAD